MALHHATPGEIIDLAQAPDDLPEDQSIALFKTTEIEVIRRVLQPGQRVPQHQLAGPVVLHCLSGTVRLTLQQSQPRLAAGQMTYLAPMQPYALDSEDACVLLMTIVRRPDAASDAGIESDPVAD